MTQSILLYFPWWLHQKSHYWPFVRGIQWPLVDSPHKGQWCRALMFSLFFTWTNELTNNRDASDLRYHCTHYDVAVMLHHDNMKTSWHWNTLCITSPLWPVDSPHKGPLMHSFVVALTDWPLGDFNSVLGHFQANFSEWWLRYLLWNCPQMNAPRPYWWWVNIGSDNGLVPSGNKPLPEPILTQIYISKWHH